MNAAQKRLIVIFALIGGSLFAASQWFVGSSFKIAYEEQAVLRCLPQTFWLLNYDVQSNRIARGSLVSIDSSQYATFYPADTRLLKMVVAIEGDEVSISDSQLFINGQFGGLLVHSHYPPAITGSYILKQDEIWVSGTQETTVDSRYIGPINTNKVIAHAYALI
jgi:type IV secretory pathway protease TraF